jgi:hypothetical protein
MKINSFENYFCHSTGYFSLLAFITLLTYALDLGIFVTSLYGRLEYNIRIIIVAEYGFIF